MTGRSTRAADLTLEVRTSLSGFLRGLPRRPPGGGFSVKLAQFVLGGFEPAAALLGQVLAGPIDVEGQHRHGRPIGVALAPAAALGRILERASNRARLAFGEYVAFQIEGVAGLGHSLRPALGFWSCHGRLLSTPRR